jgi:hypothetical protein
MDKHGRQALGLAGVLALCAAAQAGRPRRRRAPK